MAEQPQYIGATYDKAYYRQEGESLFDYMRRLAELRAKGILGGGGMLDVATPAQAEIAAAAPLGEVVINQPSSSDSSLPTRPITKQEQYEGMRAMMDYPLLATGARALIPMGLGNLFLRDSQIEANVRNAQNEATGHQGFFDYLFGRDGDVVLGDKGTGSGSLVTGQATDMSGYLTNPVMDFSKISYTPSGLLNQAVAYPITTQIFNPRTVATGIDAINPTGTNYQTMFNDAAKGGSYTVYTPSSWTPSDIQTASESSGNVGGVSSWTNPDTGDDTPSWYSAATGESWN